MNHHAWSTLQLLIVVVAAVSPFWFLAGDLADMSEAKATGLGVVIVSAVSGAMKVWQSMHGGDGK